jgi:tRNA pseudouridine synthase 10
MSPDAASPTFALDERGVAAAEKTAALGLCHECVGRFFGRLGHGLTNRERAERIAVALNRDLADPRAACALCRGAFDRWETWVDRIRRAGDGYEWHRFTCGSRWDPEILAQEESWWQAAGTEWGESARAAFNRELGKRVETATGALGGTEGAEIVFLADLPVGRIEITVQPLYLKGRYRKLDRTLPQTKWPCRRCQGRGCEHCQGTGKTYPTSVEELIAAPAIAVTQAEGSRFHGMGREDIDARMLGRGRPFVLELLRPRVRTLDLSQLGAAMQRSGAERVEVVDLAFATGPEVVRIKEAAPEKSYRVGVLGTVEVEKVKAALSLATARAIAQRTPTRVAHRRADRVRPRRIVAATVVAGEEGRFTLDIRTEAGTYVKEWVEGDGGRTDPSLAQLVGVPLRVEYLDVLEIHDS